MLTVVCWRWKPINGYRSTYSAETVNTLRRMVGRHFHQPFRFMCVTDDSDGIDRAIEVLPPWNDFADVPSPHGGRNPSCYRRLRLFHPDAGQWFGDRFVSLDLDTLIVADVTPLWDRPEDVVFYGDTNPLPGSHYNGSMMLLKAGSRPKVWTDFDPKTSPQKSKQSGCWGSDQGWISYCLGGGEAKWTKADGVYSYRNHIAKFGRTLPANARVVIWHGKHDPWSPEVAELPWVKAHYK